MLRSPARWLLCVVVVGLLAVCPCAVTALSFPLYSSDFAFSPDLAVQSNVLAKGPSRCLMLELMARDKWWHNTIKSTTFGTLRFAVTSNVTSPDLRNAVVVTMHPPADSQPWFSDITRVENWERFLPKDVEARRTAASTKMQRLRTLKRLRDNAQDPAAAADIKGLDGGPGSAAAIAKELEELDTFDERSAGSITVKITPLEAAKGGPAKVAGGTRNPVSIVEGNYAVCFYLDRTNTPSGRQGRTTQLQERVDIDIVELFSSSSSLEGDYMLRSRAARAPGTSGDDGKLPRNLRARTLSVADLVYEGTMRKIYKAKDGTSINELLVQQRQDGAGEGGVPGPVGNGNFFSPNELRANSKELLNTQRMVFNIIDATTKHLHSSERMQSTSESTFTRIWVAAVALLVVVCGSVYSTFAYTKHIVIKKKLV